MCVYENVCVCVCVCVFMFLCACVLIYVHACMCVCVRACVRACMYVSMHACTRVFECNAYLKQVLKTSTENRIIMLLGLHFLQYAISIGNINMQYQLQEMQT